MTRMTPEQEAAYALDNGLPWRSLSTRVPQLNTSLVMRI
jgi:hypothetical protein